MKITKLLKGAPITHITRSVEPTPWELKDEFPGIAEYTPTITGWTDAAWPKPNFLLRGLNAVGKFINDEILLNPNGIRTRNYQRLLSTPSGLQVAENFDIAKNVAEFTNIASAGLLNRLSPSLNIGLIIDTFLGDNVMNSWFGNSGIVSDKFILEHPYWSMAANGVFDIGTYVLPGAINNARNTYFTPNMKLKLDPATGTPALYNRLGIHLGNGRLNFGTLKYKDTPFDEYPSLTHERFGQPLGFGEEAEVYVDALDPNYVLKVYGGGATLFIPGTYNVDPAPILLKNLIPGIIPQRMIGTGTLLNGSIVPIFRLPRMSSIPSAGASSRFVEGIMSKNGYTPVGWDDSGSALYFNGKKYVHDIHEQNVGIDASGKMGIIDGLIDTPESLPEWTKDYYRNTTNPTK